MGERGARPGTLAPTPTGTARAARGRGGVGAARNVGRRRRRTAAEGGGGLAPPPPRRRPRLPGREAEPSPSACHASLPPPLLPSQRPRGGRAGPGRARLGVAARMAEPPSARATFEGSQRDGVAPEHCAERDPRRAEGGAQGGAESTALEGGDRTRTGRSPCPLPSREHPSSKAAPQPGQALSLSEDF